VKFRGPQRRVHGLPITNRTHYAVSAVLIIFGFGVGSRLLIGEDGELHGMPSARAVGDGGGPVRGLGVSGLVRRAYLRHVGSRR
jgi:hypothetical protein